MNAKAKKSTKTVTPLQISAEIIDELKGAITEGLFNSRWELIKAYHHVGQVLIEHEKEMPKNYVKLVAEELGQKERLIYQVVQFYRRYPDLDKLPMGKNISWHKIANNLLPAHKETKVSPEEKLMERIEAFFKVKSVDAKTRPIAKQIIEEWEEFKKNA